MKFDGRIYRRDRSVTCFVPIQGNIRFGKVCNPATRGAERTGVFRRLEGGGREELWAVPLEGKHGNTNKLYGDDGRTYLMLDGKFYVAPKKRVCN